MEVARARQAALEAHGSGDWDRGYQILAEAAEQARAMGIDDMVVREEIADISMSAESFNDRSLDMRDVKYMKAKGVLSASEQAGVDRAVSAG